MSESDWLGWTNSAFFWPPTYLQWSSDIDQSLLLIFQTQAMCVKLNSCYRSTTARQGLQSSEWISMSEKWKWLIELNKLCFPVTWPHIFQWSYDIYSNFFHSSPHVPEVSLMCKIEQQLIWWNLLPIDSFFMSLVFQTFVQWLHIIPQQSTPRCTHTVLLQYCVRQE